MSVHEFRLTPAPEDQPQTDADAWDRAFDEFYSRYPRRIAKVAARRAWPSVRPNSRDGFEKRWKAILRVLRHFKEREWYDTPKDKIPYPATWLRRESFDPEDVDDLVGP